MRLKTINIGIWGLGLIGGSLAKALRARAAALAERGLELGRLFVFDRDASALAQALSEGVADGALALRGAVEEDFALPELRAALAELDVLYLALPMPQIAAYAAGIAALTPCLMTDVGSVKRPVVEGTRGLRFIAGHPMAGSERQGYACGQAHLFENAVWVFCESGARASASDRRLLGDLAEALGARTLEMTAAAHDRAVAAVSHLPHVTAAALVRLLAEQDDPALQSLAAGGFKDLTRIASGDPSLWAGICLANRAALLPALDAYLLQLQQFRALLEPLPVERRSADESENLAAYFADAKACRDHLPEGLAGGLQTPSPLLIELLDQPGELAHITRVLGEAGINIRNIGIQDARQYEGGTLRLYLADGGERARAARILEVDGYVCN